MEPDAKATKKHRPKKSWMQEHVNDPYVRKASAEGWRSRAVFKLSEIDAKDRLFKPGMTVVDLGAAPGSWCQYAAKRVQPGGRVIALDLLAMEPLPGVEAICGDFREETVLRSLEEKLAGRQVDLVLSDMAPNMSGISSSDQARAAHLAELALEFSCQHLKPGGSMLVKVFQGSDFAELVDAVKKAFSTTCIRKPSASRDRSPEVFLLGKSKCR